jgi:hypothetical protein
MATVKYETGCDTMAIPKEAERSSTAVGIREITSVDYPLLNGFLYHAIFVPPGTDAPPREAIYNPDVYLYIDGFGSKPGDCGVVAEADGQVIGAAWERIIPAHCHIRRRYAGACHFRSVRYSHHNDIERDCGVALNKLNDTDWTVLNVHETAEVFTKLIAALWQAHPFREGNTRTVITFATQFAEAHGFRMDKTFLLHSMLIF